MDYEIMMNGTVRIGQKAPEFEAETTMGRINLNDYKGKWVVFFSHPRWLYPRVYSFQTFRSVEKTVFLKKKKLVLDKFKEVRTM